MFKCWEERKSTWKIPECCLNCDNLDGDVEDNGYVLLAWYFCVCGVQFPTIKQSCKRQKHKAKK